MYIRFTGDSIRGIAHEEISVHVTFKRVLLSGGLSSAIRTFIAIGNEFVTRGPPEVTEQYIKCVALLLNGAMSDVIPNYAILMWFVDEVHRQLLVVPFCPLSKVV